MEKISEKDLPHEIYSPVKSSKFKFFSLLLFFLFLGFLLNFPAFTLAENFIQDKLQLLSSRNCPIKFDQLKFNFFLPKFILPSAKIPSSCFGTHGKSLTIKDIKITLVGPSIIPIGLKLNTNFKIGKDIIDIDTIVSYNKSIIKIDKNVINISSLDAIHPQLSKISGKLNLTLKTTFESQLKQTTKFLVESKDLKILPIEIPMAMMSTPFLDMKNLKLKGQLNSKGNQNKLDLSSLNLGTAKSPFSADMKGKIDLNFKSILLSKLDLDLKLRIGDQLKEQYGFLIDGILSSKLEQKNGHYEGKLNGTFSNIILNKKIIKNFAN